jgi:hypothetical protein
VLFKSASRTGLTAVANVGRLVESGAVIRDEVGAESIAQSAVFAEFEMTRGITNATDHAFLTAEAIDAGVVLAAEASDSLDGKVQFHLL